MLEPSQFSDDALFSRLPAPGTTKHDLILENVTLEETLLTDTYREKIFSMFPDQISYSKRKELFSDVNPKNNLRFSIENRCHEIFRSLEELILNHLEEKKDIWLFPHSITQVAFSETLKENIELDYFFMMDGGSDGYFLNRCFLYRSYREIAKGNQNIKKNYSYYLKKQRKWMIHDFMNTAHLYCTFQEKRNLVAMYRYARFCQLWCESEGRKLPETVKEGLQEINLAREQYFRILELYPDVLDPRYR